MKLDLSIKPLVNPRAIAVIGATAKADRVGIRTLEDGKKVRYFKSNKELVDV